jgi:hypothetical protein
MDASESMAFVPWTWLSRGWLLGNQPNIQSCCSRRIPQDHYPLILSWNYQSHIHTLTPEQVYSVLVNLKHVPEGPPSKLPKLSPTKSKYVTPLGSRSMRMYSTRRRARLRPRAPGRASGLAWDVYAETIVYMRYLRFLAFFTRYNHACKKR